MNELQRDQAFVRVFATPAGRRLLDDMTARGRQVIRIFEIEERIARARKTWATGAPDPGEGDPP